MKLWRRSSIQQISNGEYKRLAFARLLLLLPMVREQLHCKLIEYLYHQKKAASTVTSKDGLAIVELAVTFS
jgi:hypothetical protein